MNRSAVTWANVFGSVGIAVMAVAILLVPVSEVKAAGPLTQVACNNGCVAQGISPY